MNALIGKIEENARRRLVLPPAAKPAEEISRYKQFLKVESGRLRILHRAGAGGMEVCQARAAMMDVMIRHIWTAVQSAFPCSEPAPPIALVALGGYGRAELNPGSDIDLMFLHGPLSGFSDEAQRALADWSGGLLYTLWDTGLKVGHSVRAVDDCIGVANADMQAKTSLLEARLITGDPNLFEEFTGRFRVECVQGHEDEYVAMRLADQVTRRQKHGNSPALQEPNIKNGVGGLRDYQNLLWMSFFKEGARTPEDLQRAELLGSADRRQLEAAYDFLLRARTELHHVTGRPVDVLVANVKPSVATGLGYSDRSPQTRVEAFMRDYYTHARNIFLISRTVEERLSLVPAPVPAARAESARSGTAGVKQFDGFKAVEGRLQQVYKTALRDDPRRFLRAFLHCQQRGLVLHPDLVQLMRQQVELVNRVFVADRHNHVTFLEILNQRGNVAAHLRAMHEVGFLGKFIPEFGRLTNLVQHEFYHQYAVDEHTLTCIEKLDHVWDATERPYARYTTLLRGLERPFVLYLALLLHDAGKASNTGRHEIEGGELALKVARRLRLDSNTTRTLQRIIRMHLAMVQISQRRDLEGPDVIAEFAGKIEDQENLDLLTLHTFCDSMGTSDTLWNGFKDSLLWSLYHKTSDLLHGGTEFIQAERRRREEQREEVRQALPKTFAADELEAHYTGLPARYFQLHSTREIARDITMAHRFMHLQRTGVERALEPVVSWDADRDRGYAAVQVCTWDWAGLFSKITGALTAAGLNIFGAQVFTRDDGIVLDTFYVAEAGGLFPGTEVRARFEKILQQVLTGNLELAKAIARAPRYPSLWQAAGESIPVKVRIDNRTSPIATVIDLEAEDSVGLLYRVSRVLHRLGLSISFARIVTEKGAAMDTFYVVDREGKKVEDPAQSAVVEKKLRDALNA